MGYLNVSRDVDCHPDLSAGSHEESDMAIAMCDRIR
jgi:hypothetical protein